jgi:transposase-like protein
MCRGIPFDIIIANRRERNMKRRKWSAEEKMNIVMEGLKGEQSIAEI